MIEKDKFINGIINFINDKLANMANNSPMFDIFVRPYLAKMVNVNINKIDKALSLITDESGMVDAEGLINDMVDQLVIAKANTINGISIGEGSIKINIPVINKTLVFNQEDFDELKNNIKKYENTK